MKILATVMGVLFLFIGTIWMLQGVNILPKSEMSGRWLWVVIGGMVNAGGVIILYSNNFKKQK